MSPPLSPATTTLTLEPAVQDRLSRLAADRHLSVEGLMQEAVLQYLRREDAGEQMRADARAAWAAYQADGLHADEAEVDAWLEKLEAGEEADPPACHP